MIPNAIVMANGKGGVGKTSLTANVGGMAALSGWKTLLVDLDPQANLCDELGILHHRDYDHGSALMQAAFSGLQPEPIRGVRENLDVLAGGEETKNLRNLLVMKADVTNLHRIDDSLGLLAREYDLVLIDTPPATDPLVKAALVAARFLVLVTRTDSASIRGIVHTSEVFAETVSEGLNPDLEVMGVVRFNIASTHTARLRNATTRIEGVLDGLPIPVFDTFVRTADKTADDVRDTGQLVHEYVAEAAEAVPFYEHLKNGTKPAQSFGSNAEALATDYLNLWVEIRERYLASLEDANA